MWLLTSVLDPARANSGVCTAGRNRPRYLWYRLPAVDSKLNRVVAVKIPRAGRFASADEEERFLREATAVARLDHPGIVKIFDIGRDHGVCVYRGRVHSRNCAVKLIDSGKNGVS